MTLAKLLNKRVLLQQPGTGQDGAGQPLDGWVNVVPGDDGKLWAEVRDISGREYLAAGADQSDVRTRIRIRQREGIDPSMRVVHGADVYSIAVVLRRTDGTLHLMCRKGGA